MRTIIALLLALSASVASAADWIITNPVDDVTYRRPPEWPHHRVCHRQPVMRFVGYQERIVVYPGGFWRTELFEVWERSDAVTCR